MLSGAVVDVVCIIVVGVVGSVVGVVDDEKEDCSYKINPYLFSVSHCVSLLSVCYQATNVSPSCPCVTVKQMLV